ncbi:MAG TPA: hypothetical protein VGU71_11585 [Candidatus Dormibacteraeota bacterium]|nr:hypothetical protein [Candidatus Dormibacteraeota bacterium]
MKSNSLAIGFVILTVVCIVVAALYAVGILQFFASTNSGPHEKHAILFGVLAIASLIAANFTRERTV